MELLPHLQILEIHAAVTNLGLGDHDVLLSGLDPSFVGSLRKVDGGGLAQVLRDLGALNRTLELSDGALPLRTWLQNALALSGARPESEVFRRALARL